MELSLTLGMVAGFLAMFVKGLAAFGNTLVFSPLMNFQSDTRLVAPVDLFMTLPANGYMAWKGRKDASLKIILPLVVLIYLGLIPGAFFLKVGDSQTLKVLLGLAVVALGVEMLLRERAIAKHGRKPSKPLGPGPHRPLLRRHVRPLRRGSLFDRLSKPLHRQPEPIPGQLHLRVLLREHRPLRHL